MLSNIGISGIILIVIMAIVVFGPRKLPEIGKSLGKSLKEFRDATNHSGNAQTNQASEAQTVSYATETPTAASPNSATTNNATVNPNRDVQQ